MKDKILCFLLLCEAALCVLFCFFSKLLPTVFTALAAFPFQQIALALRMLSLSGWIGNAISIVLYFLVCLIPIGALVCIRSKMGRQKEDCMLVFLSGVLFVFLYLMINPTLLGVYAAFDDGNILAAMLGGGIYSVLVAYIVLCALRRFSVADIGGLQQYLTALFAALAIIFVFQIFGNGLSGWMQAIDALRQNNTGTEDGLFMTYLFLFLRFLFTCIPYALDLSIVFSARHLLHALSRDAYGSQAALAAQQLSAVCVRTLIVTVLATVAINIAQLFFIPALRDINIVLDIPVVSLLFALVSLLVSQFVSENKRLKEDNDLFI